MHAIDTTSGRVAVRRERLLELLAQFPRCVVGMEACSAAHHWARELTQLGHDTRIMAAEFVRPFRKSLAAKNDANDAEAVCTAMMQPNTRVVRRLFQRRSASAQRCEAPTRSNQSGTRG